jgi:hypothetical protein
MNLVEIKVRVRDLVQKEIEAKGYVCMIDILLGLEYLSKKDLEAWRFGKIDYLERVCMLNLSKITSIYKMLKIHARELNLSPSYTGYNRYGKGVPQRLIFSKSGDRQIEENYSTHYIDKEYFKEKQKKVCV